MNGIPLNIADGQNFIGLAKPADVSSLKRESQVGNLQGKADGADELRKAAKEFEAVFMSQLLKQMRSTVHKEEMFHGGAGEDIFTEMLDEEFAKKMSVRGTGIADMLYQQLSRQFGIEDSEILPTTGSGNLLQQKMQEIQRRNDSPPEMSVNI